MNDKQINNHPNQHHPMVHLLVRIGNPLYNGEFLSKIDKNSETNKHKFLV